MCPIGEQTASNANGVHIDACDDDLLVRVKSRAANNSPVGHLILVTAPLPETVAEIHKCIVVMHVVGSVSPTVILAFEINTSKTPIPCNGQILRNKRTVRH